jgi:hypothetical protein
MPTDSSGDSLIDMEMKIPIDNILSKEFFVLEMHLKFPV